MSFAVMRWHVSNDEESFTWSNQTKFFAGEIFDCDGIPAQQARLFAKFCVFDSGTCYRSCELFVLALYCDRCEQSVVTDETVDEQHPT